LRAFRIGDRRWPLFDGTGAARFGGRWNSPGMAAIYASTSFACAMLERLAQTGTGRIPKDQVAVVIDIPDALTIEHAPFDHAIPPLPLNDSRAFGDRWLIEQRSIVLTVPSAVSPYDRNLLINPAHPDCGRISCSEPELVVWDRRLFREVER
jgi:RES domain-containing protein